MAKSQLLSQTDKQTQVWSLELCAVDVEKTIAISKGLTINVNFILENASFPKHDEQELLLLVTDRGNWGKESWGDLTPNFDKHSYTH